MKHMTEKGKIVVKKYDFRVKKRSFGRKQSWVGNQSRKAKWCKTQVFFLKKDKLEDMRG